MGTTSKKALKPKWSKSRIRTFQAILGSSFLLLLLASAFLSFGTSSRKHMPAIRAASMSDFNVDLNHTAANSPFVTTDGIPVISERRGKGVGKRLCSEPDWIVAARQGSFLRERSPGPFRRFTFRTLTVDEFQSPQHFICSRKFFAFTDRVNRYDFAKAIGHVNDRKRLFLFIQRPVQSMYPAVIIDENWEWQVLPFINRMDILR